MSLYEVRAAKEVVGCAAGCGDRVICVPADQEAAAVQCPACGFAVPVGPLRVAWGLSTAPEYPEELPRGSDALLWTVRLAPEQVETVKEPERAWFFHPRLRRKDAMAWRRHLRGNPNSLLPVEIAISFMDKYALEDHQTEILREAVNAVNDDEIKRAAATERTIRRVLSAMHRRQQIAGKKTGGTDVLCSLIQARPDRFKQVALAASLKKVDAAWDLMLERAVDVCRLAATLQNDREDPESFRRLLLTYSACQSVASALVKVAVPLKLGHQETGTPRQTGETPC